MTIWFHRGLRAAMTLATLATVMATGQAVAQTRCPGGNGGLVLSPGFCATVFADNLGHVRHLAVAADGTLYANTWSGGYYRTAAPAAGFLIALKDANGDGQADAVQRFGATPQSGGTGGTGIALHDGALYAEDNGRILRYALTPGVLVPSAAPSVVVSGLPLTGDHPMHPFVIDAKGNLFVDVASATNSCQVENRMVASRGVDPCIEKQTRGGIWRYDAARSGQVFSPAERYASGIRNAEGLSIDAAGRFLATQHGRDQLYQDWPRFYTAEQSADLPAEELMEITKGADYGWPECYYDQHQKKLVLAPEYGGDGGKTVGLCAQRQGPIAAFPGHWAPNALAIYLADTFPASYRGGAFIAFHGSWNRAPLPQGGYNVVFQPLADGKAAGPFIVFADGFDGGHKEPGRAAFRPTGLAVAPDGALFVSDDVHGRIWRITYTGNGSDKPTSASGVSSTATASRPALPPEGIHPDAGRKTPALPTPPGATADQVALGDRIYHGEVSSGACSGCHGSDGSGSPLGPPLNARQWTWSDGSLAGLRDIIAKGVARPKRYQGAMPPMGGSPLSQQDLAAVSAYVWAISHAKDTH